MDADRRDVSEFNSAVAYLNRLNLLLLTADEHSISLDVYSWFHTLLAIFRELSTELKQKEIDEYSKRIKQLNEKINGYLQRVNMKGYAEVSHELYQDLHEFEIFLRTVMKQSGLQQKIMDEASKALR